GIVGGLIDVAIPKQRAEIIGICRGWIGRSRSSDCAGLNQIDIAAEAAAVRQIAAAISHICDLKSTLPGCALRNSEAPAIGIRLFVIVAVNRCWRGWRCGNVQATEVSRK